MQKIKIKVGRGVQYPRIYVILTVTIAFLHFGVDKPPRVC